MGKSQLVKSYMQNVKSLTIKIAIWTPKSQILIPIFNLKPQIFYSKSQIKCRNLMHIHHSFTKIKWDKNRQTRLCPRIQCPSRNPLCLQKLVIFLSWQQRKIPLIEQSFHACHDFPRRPPRLRLHIGLEHLLRKWWARLAILRQITHFIESNRDN